MGTLASYSSAAVRIAAAALFIALILVIWPYRQAAPAAIQAIEKWGNSAPDPRAVTGTLDRLQQGANQIGAAADALAGAASTAQGAIDKIGALAPALGDAVDQTSTNLNRPCKGEAGPDACGALASFSKAAAKAGDAIVETQLSERAVLPHTIVAMDALKDDADSLNAILKNQAIGETAQNIAGMTAHGNAILGDAQKETDALVAPKTTKQKIFGWLPTAIKLGAIGACIGTGTPCP